MSWLIYNNQNVIIIIIYVTLLMSVACHFVPTFIFNLVIPYPVWSFRTHFVTSLVISYLLLLFSRKPFWSCRTYFLLFRTQVISYPKSFRTHFSHFVPRSYRTHFQTRYELTWVRIDFLFCCNLLLPDYVRIDFGMKRLSFFSVTMYGGSLYGSLGASWKGRTTF